MQHETPAIYLARKLKADILLQPLKDQAIKLIMQAAMPNGLTVNDEGGEYFVNSDGLVSWTNHTGNQSRDIQNMPAGNVLFWTSIAAETLAKSERALKNSFDPTGLGL